MKKFFVFSLAFLFIVSLSACGNTNGSNNVEEPKEDIAIVCDISKYANISSSELIGLLGNPNKISETTTATGFVDVPCVYYDYYSAEELGDVSFILINDIVVKFISYNDFPLYEKEDLLASFNVIRSNECAIEDTETSLRFRCLTDKIDDLWITNFENQSYGFLAVTYDMLYFEEWYLPLSSTEQIEYQTDAEMRMKNVLTFPKTADFPWYDWQFWKNQFYVIVSSYVDAENAFGAEIRTTFTFVYSRLTKEPVYVVINDEVVVNDGYIPTADLIKQLVNEMATEKTKQETFENSENTSPETTTNINFSNSAPIITEDMNSFLYYYILPKYVVIDGELHDTIEYDSNENTDWCYKLVGYVGNNSYEAMVYPFQLGKGNEITDLWIKYLYWNDELILENDSSECINYAPQNYW